MHDRLAVLNTIAHQSLMNLFTHSDVAVAKQVTQAIYSGGGRILEFTNRVTHAPSIFAELQQYVAEELPDMVLGVGSVEDAATAAQFVSAGAEFVVSPLFDADVALYLNQRKVPYLPGAMTLAEVAEAERYGSEFVKLYPAMNPAMVSAIAGPRPWTRVVANGPIGHDQAPQWFAAGVAGIGTMATVPPDAVANGDFDAISRSVEKMLAVIADARQERSNQ